MSRRSLLQVTVSVAAMSLTLTSLVWAQAVVPPGRVATVDGVGANAWSGNIRASDADLVALFEEGVKRSQTFRGLVDRLSKSDVILYVRPDVTARSNAPTRLTFLAAKGGYRYLVIRVTPGRSKEQQLAMLGHEMQHAVAIADASSVVDSQSLKREFERIGKVTQPTVGDDFFFESTLAEETKRRIMSEVSSEAGKAASKMGSAAR
jgi:hypothetical protein